MRPLRLKKSASASSAFPAWYSRLSREFRRCLMTDTLTDVTIVCDGGKVVPAHRLMLGIASPLLRRVLECEVTEDCEPLAISLPDFADSDVRKLLHNIYTGETPKLDVELDSPVHDLIKLLLRISAEPPPSPVLSGPTRRRQMKSVEKTSCEIANILHEKKRTAEGVNMDATALETVDELMAVEADEARTSTTTSVMLLQPAADIPRPAASDAAAAGPASAAAAAGAAAASAPHATAAAKVSPACHNSAPMAADGRTVTMKSPAPGGCDRTLSLARSRAAIDSAETSSGVEASVCELLTVASSDFPLQPGLQLMQMESGEMVQVFVTGRSACGGGGGGATDEAVSFVVADRPAPTIWRALSTPSLAAVGVTYVEVTEDGTAIVTRSEVGAAPPDDSLECPLCLNTQAAHKTRNGLTDEAESDESRVRYKCCNCKATRLSAKNFLAHVSGHLEHKFSCEQCDGVSFPTEQSRYHHVHLYHAKKGRKLSASSSADPAAAAARADAATAGRKSVSESASSPSAPSAPPAPPAPPDAADDLQTKVKCPACERTFKRRYFEQVHRKQCGEAATQNFKCAVCGQQGFSTKYTLRDHLRAKHSSSRPYQCEYCAGRFATPMILYSHRANRHGMLPSGQTVRKKAWPCEICGKQLTRKAKLSDHIRVVHNGVRQFRCGFCDKRFTSKSNAQVHEATIHTGILPYKCGVCQKMFTRKGQLEQHLIQQHGEAVLAASGCAASVLLTAGEADADDPAAAAAAAAAAITGREEVLLTVEGVTYTVEADEAAEDDNNA